MIAFHGFFTRSSRLLLVVHQNCAIRDDILKEKLFIQRHLQVKVSTSN